MRVVLFPDGDYDEVLRFQMEYHREVVEGGEEVLVLTEHLPVITVGRRGSRDDVHVDEAFLQSRGIKLRDVSRGGAVTCHGPGQLVAYPILDLRRRERDVHLYIRMLEEVVMKSLSRYGIVSHRRDSFTGVWTARGKIASIGVALRRWVTYHGVAVNVTAAVKGLFSLITPCSISGCSITTISDETGRDADVWEYAGAFCEAFEGAFGALDASALHGRVAG